MSTPSALDFVLVCAFIFMMTTVLLLSNKLSDARQDRNDVYKNMYEEMVKADGYMRQLEEAGIEPVKVCP